MIFERKDIFESEGESVGVGVGGLDCVDESIESVGVVGLVPFELMGEIRNRTRQHLNLLCWSFLFLLLYGYLVRS